MLVIWSLHPFLLNGVVRVDLDGFSSFHYQDAYAWTTRHLHITGWLRATIEQPLIIFQPNQFLIGVTPFLLVTDNLRANDSIALTFMNMEISGRIYDWWGSYLRLIRNGHQRCCKYFAIFKSCIFTLSHLPILTQPSRLSVCDLRSFIILLSGPL